jgi:hypothetical protein
MKEFLSFVYVLVDASVRVFVHVSMCVYFHNTFVKVDTHSYEHTRTRAYVCV